jgi:hypothetical protein
MNILELLIIQKKIKQLIIIKSYKKEYKIKEEIFIN